jgi:hypothetical protein
MDGTVFDEGYDGGSFYKPPTNLAVGLNENSPRYEALVSHMKLVDEVARSSDITAGDDYMTSVSESTKVTAKFRSDVLPPKIVHGTIAYYTDTTHVHFDDVEGLLVGDAVFFSDTNGVWVYDEDKLSPNFIKDIGAYDDANSGYPITLRHALKEAKNTSTKWSAGKLKEKEMDTIREFGLFSEPIEERDVESYYLGNRTGATGSPAEVGNPFSTTDSGMGYGDYQYDELLDEDSIAKTSDMPPAFFSEEQTQTMDYLIDVTGIGFTTIPIMGMYQGTLSDSITFDEDDNYGRQLPLDELIDRYMDTVIGPVGAINISPLSKMSHIEVKAKGRRVKKRYLPSKWNLTAGWISGDESRSSPSWGWNTKKEVYRNGYASQLFVFAVDNDIDKEQLKDINVVWRGAARSWDGSDYRDGVSVFYWHIGDKQPLYSENDDGSYDIVGRVGDARTFNEHWEKIEMLDITTGEEHDSIVPTGEDSNALYMTRSNHNGGADNRVGVNRVGYSLTEDNKIFVLVTTKYSSNTESAKASSLSTDFVGLSIGTSNIFENQVKNFRKGVDFYYDPDWKFIAWPPLDYKWNSTSTSYDTRFSLSELATISRDADAGTHALENTGSSWIVPGTMIVLVADASTETPSGQTEIVTISPNDTAWKPYFYRTRLSAPLVYDWKRGDKIYGYISNDTEFPIQVLKKAIIPDFPTRGYTNQNIAAIDAFSGDLETAVTKGGTTLYLSNTAGFKNNDVVMIWRTPTIDTENACGHEWQRVTSDPQHDDRLPITSVDRENVDNGTSAYDEGASNLKTDVGIVKYQCPKVDPGFSLSWLVGEGSWSDGDASGSKWRLQTSKWGKVQYPSLEAVIRSSDGSFLTSTSPPSYTGWDTYGGPGVKIEYYDAVNGYIWLTKAYDITLKAFTDGNTDTDSEKQDNVYRNAVLKDGYYNLTSVIHYWTIYTDDPDATTTSEDNDFAYGWESYGNSDALNADYVTHPLKIPRNGTITMKSTDNNAYYQLSLAETISHSGWYDDNWKLKPKYRCLEASGKTCVKGSDINTDETAKTWYLDAPYFEHDTDDTYDYHDEKTGKVVFILDVVLQDEAEKSLAMPNGTSAGDTVFTLAGEGSNIDVHEVMLLIKSGGTGYEMVQVTDVDTATHEVTVTPPLLNSYDSGDTIYWKFNDVDAGHSYLDSTRLVITPVQVYGPLESSDKAVISARLYRAAKYNMKFAREQSNMLAYSLLKDTSVFRPVRSDMADTLQFTQEVKFKYHEKDMV